ncbi:regulator of Ty1 Transposition [Coemansia sp. RSA 2611]|nr:regulator of Ty1 Transposition [Coemansia sp. RSA 2611]
MLGSAMPVAATAPRPRPIAYSEAEQESFVRRSDPLFAGVVFWINPIYGAAECDRIGRLLEQGGAKPATPRRHSGARSKADGDAEVRKINGVLVRAVPNMVSHISRFHLPSARNMPPRSTDTPPIQRATHVVSPDTHFGEYAVCVKAGVCVVTSHWVERSAAAGWQYVERYFSPAAQDIFSGMVIAATHMPAADKETLLASVMALGGQWREKLRSDVTHFILMKDEGAKYEFVKTHPEYGITPILPHWFKETLNLLRRVPQDPYVFPNPPVLFGQAVRAKGKEAEATSMAASLAIPSADTHNGNVYELPKPATPFLQGYVLAIAAELRYSLSEGAIARLTQRLSEAGAEVYEPSGPLPDHAQQELPESLITDWNCVDILLCQHRSGYEYSKASRLGKIVGTCVWLYQAYLSEKITPPTQKLLHYPVPTASVPKMDRMVVTVSHYTGASRDYLQRLIIAMGAQYTPRMTRETTHLVTAMAEGRKYAAAIQWNVEIVNHLWIEQCYQRWKLLSVSHPAFTHFPGLPVLNSMVGDTEIEVNRLTRWVDPPQGEVLAETSDMELLDDSDLEADFVGGSGSEAPAIPVRAGTSHIYKIQSHFGQLQNGEVESGDEAKSVSESADEAVNGDQPDEALGVGQTRHTSRAAAMAASKTLGEMMKAANIFETEMRKERLTKYRRSTNGRRTLTLAEGEEVEADNNLPSHQKGRGVRESSANGELSPAAGPRSKRQRTGSAVRSEERVRLLFTQLRPLPDELEQIIAMGGEVVDSATHATHLVCTRVKRTLKMLMALASGHVKIVGSNWLKDSLAQRRWIHVDFVAGGPDAERYGVQDSDCEKQWNFKLSESIRRSHERLMLEGVTVFVTPNSNPEFSVLRPLIEIAGGEAVTSLPEKRLQRLLKKSWRVMQTKGAVEATAMPLLVVTSKLDSDMWPMFQLSAEQRVPLYDPEVILLGLLRQRVLLHSSEFDVEASN